MILEKVTNAVGSWWSKKTVSESEIEENRNLRNLMFEIDREIDQHQKDALTEWLQSKSMKVAFYVVAAEAILTLDLITLGSAAHNFLSASNLSVASNVVDLVTTGAVTIATVAVPMTYLAAMTAEIVNEKSRAISYWLTKGNRVKNHITMARKESAIHPARRTDTFTEQTQEIEERGNKNTILQLDGGLYYECNFVSGSELVVDLKKSDRGRRSIKWLISAPYLYDSESNVFYQVEPGNVIIDAIGKVRFEPRGYRPDAEKGEQFLFSIVQIRDKYYISPSDSDTLGPDYEYVFAKLLLNSSDRNTVTIEADKQILESIGVSGKAKYLPQARGEGTGLDAFDKLLIMNKEIRVGQNVRGVLTISITEGLNTDSPKPLAISSEVINWNQYGLRIGDNFYMNAFSTTTFYFDNDPTNGESPKLVRYQNKNAEKILHNESSGILVSHLGNKLLIQAFGLGYKATLSELQVEMKGATNVRK